jgi:hypothetical protein
VLRYRHRNRCRTNQNDRCKAAHSSHPISGGGRCDFDNRVTALVMQP